MFCAMAPTKHRGRVRSNTARHKDHRSTRRQLLEVAGQEFAARGFDRATGKEICKRAGANTAAVNYHFGSMNGLYAAVLQEAHDRLVSLDALSAAAAAKPDARSKLQAVLELFAHSVTGPSMSSWVLRVLGREMVAPSPALKALDEKVRLPKARIMKAIIGELMGLSEDDPAVARGCISIMAPCVMLLIADRGTLKRVFPNLGLSAEDADALAQHMIQFAIAGLSAVAAGTRKAGNRRVAK
jgi:TetR/AcrR family transcriptional regulator, regulator of cefoperazone and chloramphenicol sensitivity